MNWPWFRKKPEPDMPAECDGAKAREAAQEHLQETRDQWPEVNQVAASLRDLRMRNGFAEQLNYIFQGRDADER